MALRGTLTHRKTRRLAALMGAQLPAALGYVEALWHVTAEHAIAGDIGRMSDEDIAMEMFYTDDPAKLIGSLQTAGFLDPHPIHRLVVHDWSQHAPNHVRLFLATNHLTFSDGNPPRPNQHLRVAGSSRRIRRRDRELLAGCITNKLRRAVYARDGWQCVYCGSPRDRTLDHIIPVSLEGKTTFENLQTLCRPCNSKKGNRLETRQ